MDRPYVLAETTWKTIRSANYEVAVLPWGATEAHNLHLPYGTDTMQAKAVAIEAARLAWDEGARVVVLPSVPFGVNTGQREIPFCLNMNPSTELALLRDILDSLETRVRKLVILNGHGGNDFRQILRELEPKTSVFLTTINWYAVLDPQPFFSDPGDHAGELETSLMLHLNAEQVLPLSEAGPGRPREFRIEALRKGWAWAPRHWIEVTDDTGVGNPAAATKEQGSRYFAAVTRAIASFLTDLAAADPATMYS
jgi:creatinine amidohydrolase